jgi:hypothetical protein
MQKRSFTRYDAHIDGRYCAADGSREWKPCLITKISRKGIGVVFSAGAPPYVGSSLQFTLSAIKESECMSLRGVLRWVKSAGNCHAGGIELNAIVEDSQWLQLIYFIRQPAAEKQVIDLKTMTNQAVLNRNVHPPPAKLIIQTTKLDYIKSILNYKIL